MKKILSIILAFCMIFALTMTVFAESSAVDTGTGTGTGSIGIGADYVAGTDNKGAIDAGTNTKVYFLTLSWVQNGTISYYAGTTTYTWNSSTLKYDADDGTAGRGWTVTDANVVITATNRSDAAMTVTCGTPVCASGVDSITGSYDATTINLASAATNSYNGTGAEQTGSATYTITGVTGTGWTSGNIATITLTVNPA